MTNNEVFINIIREMTDEAVTMTATLLQHWLKRVLSSPHLSDEEKTYAASVQLVVLMTMLNDHLENIGESNFEVVALQVHRIMDRERKGQNQALRLSKLAALLVPLPSFKSSLTS